MILFQKLVPEWELGINIRRKMDNLVKKLLEEAVSGYHNIIVLTIINLLTIITLLAKVVDHCSFYGELSNDFSSPERRLQKTTLAEGAGRETTTSSRTQSTDIQWEKISRLSKLSTSAYYH